jgi:hypothetical protein
MSDNVIPLRAKNSEDINWFYSQEGPVADAIRGHAEQAADSDLQRVIGLERVIDWHRVAYKSNEYLCDKPYFVLVLFEDSLGGVYETTYARTQDGEWAYWEVNIYKQRKFYTERHPSFTEFLASRRGFDALEKALEYVRYQQQWDGVTVHGPALYTFTDGGGRHIEIIGTWTSSELSGFGYTGPMGHNLLDSPVEQKVFACLGEDDFCPLCDIGDSVQALGEAPPPSSREELMKIALALAE